MRQPGKLASPLTSRAMTRLVNIARRTSGSHPELGLPALLCASRDSNPDQLVGSQLYCHYTTSAESFNNKTVKSYLIKFTKTRLTGFEPVTPSFLNFFRREVLYPN